MGVFGIDTAVDEGDTNACAGHILQIRFLFHWGYFRGRS
jgi:hypothetical protein